MNLSEKEIIDLFEKMMVSFVFLLLYFPCIGLSVAVHNSFITAVTE